MSTDKEMWINYKKSGSLEIREKIIIKYIPLVKHVVSKFVNNLPKNIEYEDLVEYGIIGLLDAVGKFDITKDVDFKTYALLRIRGAIYDELRELDMLPRTLRKVSKNIEAAYIEIERQKGRPATDEEVCNYLNISIKELDEYFSKINVANVYSLEESIGDNEDGNSTLGSIIEDKKSENPHENLEKKEIKEALLAVIKELTEKEKTVITLYYYEELTLKEIGKVMDISESRVSQIHSKTVIKLRAKLSAKFGSYFGVV